MDKFPFEDLVSASEFTFDEIEIALNKSEKREITRASVVME